MAAFATGFVLRSLFVAHGSEAPLETNCGLFADRDLGAWTGSSGRGREVVALG